MIHFAIIIIILATNFELSQISHSNCKDYYLHFFQCTLNQVPYGFLLFVKLAYINIKRWVKIWKKRKLLVASLMHEIELYYNISFGKKFLLLAIRVFRILLTRRWTRYVLYKCWAISLSLLFFYSLTLRILSIQSSSHHTTFTYSQFFNFYSSTMVE